MNFIKAIFSNKMDETTHKKFTRYGKGEYERALIKIKKSKDKFTVKTSFDFANDFVSIIAENIQEPAEVSGKIIASRDLKKDLDLECKFSKRGKLYTAELKKLEILPEQLKELYEQFKQDFLLLSIKSNKYKLKTKTSIPKPGGKIKDDFCSATLPLELLDEFAFDISDEFKELIIKHIFKITDLEVPEEFKDNFFKAREAAIRKGKIERIIDIDGKIEKREAPLLV